EECTFNVQGYLWDCTLPPIRRFQIPRNPNPGTLLNLKQSVTLTGLGGEMFEKAVRGLSTLYQNAKGKVQQRGCQLRDWTPGEAEGDLTLTFSSRYLTPSNHATDDVRPDMAEVIDPLNILRPLLRTEVHTLDNAVFYWRRMPASAATGEHIERTTPEIFCTSNMVQVRFAVHLAKVGRHEYVFIPKLRSICLLGSEIQRVSYTVMESMYCITYVYSQDYNIASIHALTHKVVSPLKKVKRKADYGKEED
ncbi:hypothetical protein K466DRAFT_468930, partial [Polyporus arcularius HHB13444]